MLLKISLLFFTLTALHCTPIPETDFSTHAERRVMLRVAQEEDWLVTQSRKGPLLWTDSATLNHFIFLQTYVRDLMSHP